MILEKIKKHLKYKIKIILIEIYDESRLHSYSETDLTHLKIIIVSNDFINQKLINRHRMIFLHLSELLKNKIYSLTLNTHTLKEWKNKKNKINHNSKCFKKKF